MKRVELASGGFPELTVTRTSEVGGQSYRGDTERRGSLTVTLPSQGWVGATVVAGFAVLWNAAVAFML